MGDHRADPPVRRGAVGTSMFGASLFGSTAFGSTYVIVVSAGDVVIGSLRAVILSNRSRSTHLRSVRR